MSSITNTPPNTERDSLVNAEKNISVNNKTTIPLQNVIKNDKYISEVGSTLIPFSQLSNIQFNNYLRAIGR
jgi:hypothetical protein